MNSSFTQTDVWAKINLHWNGLEPIFYQNEQFKVLFGYNKKTASLVSYAGPVLLENAKPNDLDSFLKWILKQSKIQKIRNIEFRSLPPLRSWPVGFEDVFIHYKFKKIKWHTVLVNLKLNEEALFQNLVHAARKGVNKARNLGIKVKHCSNFEDYYHYFLIPYLNVMDKEKKSENFYQEAFELDSDNVYNYWVALDANNELLGFLGTYRHQGLATEIMSAMTPLAQEKKLPAQDILHWEIMLFHKALGDSYFDLAGIHPSPQTPKEMGIRRFKEKWGGSVFDVSSYIKDISPFYIKWLRRIKKVFHA